MPLYEYKCSGCGKTFEVIQKFSDEPLKTHPECGGVVERLLSAPALQFKGSGWYVTDYAKSNAPSKPAEGGSEAKSGSDAKSGPGDKKSGSESSSSESKPAAASDSKSSSSPSSTSNPK